MRDLSILSTIHHFPWVLTHCSFLAAGMYFIFCKFLTAWQVDLVFLTGYHTICLWKVQYLQSQGVHLLNFQMSEKSLVLLRSSDSLEGFSAVLGGVRCWGHSCRSGTQGWRGNQSFSFNILLQTIMHHWQSFNLTSLKSSETLIIIWHGAQVYVDEQCNLI